MFAGKPADNKVTAPTTEARSRMALTLMRIVTRPRVLANRRSGHRPQITPLRGRAIPQNQTVPGSLGWRRSRRLEASGSIQHDNWSFVLIRGIGQHRLLDLSKPDEIRALVEAGEKRRDIGWFEPEFSRKDRSPPRNSTEPTRIYGCRRSARLVLFGIRLPAGIRTTEPERSSRRSVRGRMAGEPKEEWDFWQDRTCASEIPSSESRSIFSFASPSIISRFRFEGILSLPGSFLSPDMFN